MEWSELKSQDQLDQIREESKSIRVLIFKHSRRCSVSRVALDRLERKWNTVEMGHLKPYFLDLISFPEISESVAIQFEVEHESPQVLIIENGQSVYDRSHFDIDYAQILKATRN